MKRYMASIVFLLAAVSLFAQEFDPGFDKIATVKYINDIVKPDGQKANFSSISTKAGYTENYFATATRKVYNFNLRDIKYIQKSNGVLLTCRSGSCIEYELAGPGNNEKSNISELLLMSDQPGKLLKALKLLKTRVGL